MRSLWFCGLVLAPLTVTGCSGDGGGSCGEPAYGGASTDEAWRTMVDGDADALIGDASAPEITAPSEDEVLPASGAAPLIEWTSSIARAPVRLRGRLAGRRLPLPGLHHSTGRGAGTAGLLDRLGALVEGTAWAHLPPVTGDVYYLQITVPGRDCEVTAITTDLHWQVDPDSWSAMKEATGPLSIQLTSAYLQENRITEGPYRPATPRTFRLDP